MKLSKSIAGLFDPKRARKLSKSEITMCASVVGVCLLAAVLVFVVRALLPA